MTTPTISSYSSEIKFKSLPFSVSVNTNSTEILEALKTGLFRNQPVESVTVASVQSDDETENHMFVYNVEAAKSGNQPWSIKCQAT